MKWCESAAEKQAEKVTPTWKEGYKLRSAIDPACMQWVSNLNALSPSPLAVGVFNVKPDDVVRDGMLVKPSINLQGRPPSRYGSVGLLPHFPQHMHGYNHYWMV